MANRKLPPVIALTMGEPSGISSEITTKAWQYFSQYKDAPIFFIIDDPERYASSNIPVDTIKAPSEAPTTFQHALPILDIGTQVEATPGIPSPKTADSVLNSIRKAVTYCIEGQCTAMVTNPIQKNTLVESGFTFPGHTEFLAELTKDTHFSNRTRGPVMMLAGPNLKTVPVTIHLSLKNAITGLTTQSIIETTLITYESLKHDFNISHPRIAISGLNPHAGESGLFGDEDESIITPAVNTLLAQGLNVVGPLPADTMFHEEARSKYDAAICMYHDQALIPVKTLDFHNTVNITLGLPIIRTSPDHGSALDIAGKNCARPDSLIAAIQAANTMMAVQRMMRR